MIKDYFTNIDVKLDEVYSENKEKLEESAEVLSESLQNNGIIYVFGCGHSHMFGEELLFRAGGLASVYPILHEPLMLHEGPVRSSSIERKNDYAENFMKDYDFRPEDIIFVISSSGINPVPVDVALYAKSKGLKVITVTSMEYSSSRGSRHKDGTKLFEVGDIVIDNRVAKGDVSLSINGLAEKFAPQSTILGMTILHSIIAGAVEKMIENDYNPPIFLSGNLEGSDDHNKALIDKYSKRIPLLKMGLEQ